MSEPRAEIVLYDLACIKKTCFSPVVWRIRMMLNYKKIPYTTMFLEFPDIETTLKALGIPPNTSPRDASYTVPAIHHLPTGTYLMGSGPVAQFIEANYPSPAVPFSSELGIEIEAKLRALGGGIHRTSVMPREVHILSPESADFFRRKNEKATGKKLEEILVNEDQVWANAADQMHEVEALLRANRKEGPFVLGQEPSMTDFFIAGALRSVKQIDEGVFGRYRQFPAYIEIYDACVPYMERDD